MLPCIRFFSQQAALYPPQTHVDLNANVYSLFLSSLNRLLCILPKHTWISLHMHTLFSDLDVVTQHNRTTYRLLRFVTTRVPWHQSSTSTASPLSFPPSLPPSLPVGCLVRRAAHGLRLPRQACTEAVPGGTPVARVDAQGAGGLGLGRYPGTGQSQGRCGDQTGRGLLWHQGLGLWVTRGIDCRIGFAQARNHRRPTSRYGSGKMGCAAARAKHHRRPSACPGCRSSCPRAAALAHRCPTAHSNS